MNFLEQFLQALFIIFHIFLDVDLDLFFIIGGGCFRIV